MKLNRVIGTIAKYAVLTGCGILLYILAAGYALTERGYFAVGGEGLLLFLPVLYGVAEAVVRDISRDIKDGKGVRKH